MNPLERLTEIRRRDSRLILGLSSGTSADGVDAALIRVTGNGLTLEVETIAGHTFEYGVSLRESVLALVGGSTGDVCRMNFALGEFFGNSAKQFIREAGYSTSEVDLIGSHGQTIYHVPRGPRNTPSTLQIGEPDVIAEMTRIPVIADFRTRDVAAGGDGAPLVPYVDYLLFRDRAPAAFVNIGGIANVTIVTPAFSDLIAFDTGPGNMPLDSLAQILTRGAEPFDDRGRRAGRGKVDEGLLSHLLDTPYLERQPPKTTGREEFGKDWVLGILEQKGNLGVADVLATMTLFVATSIYRSFERFVWSETEVGEIVVSGGGVRNMTLMSHLRRLFDPVPVVDLGDGGQDPHQKEAVAFAVLANETLFGNPNNVPAATGARWPTILGKISP